MLQDYIKELEIFRDELKNDEKQEEEDIENKIENINKLAERIYQNSKNRDL
jgi:hypothetical protein